MPILRLLLLVALLTAGSWLAWNMPWRADTRYNGVDISARLPDAPYFSKPARPDPKVFDNRISPFLHKDSIEISVSLDRIVLFQRFAVLVVGVFFLYGAAGYILTAKPRPIDVLYSLAITTGFIGGTVASAITAHLVPDRGALPWLNLFWAAGVAIGLLVATLGRSRPFPGTAG
jgi:hypothetical protein